MAVRVFVLPLSVQNERQPGHASQVAAAAAAHQLDDFLAQELEAQNTCPICYDLMVPPDKAPVLLFPCGNYKGLQQCCCFLAVITRGYNSAAVSLR
jgi:hypothetical protein